MFHNIFKTFNTKFRRKKKSLIGYKQHKYDQGAEMREKMGNAFQTSNTICSDFSTPEQDPKKDN